MKLSQDRVGRPSPDAQNSGRQRSVCI